MFTDAYLEIEPAFTALTSSRAATNDIYFGAGDRGVGTPLFLLVRIGTTMTTGSTSTLTINILTDDNSSFSSPRTLLSSRSYGTAELISGTEIVLRLPRGLEEYMRVSFTVGTSNFTGGTIGAWVTEQEPKVTTKYPFAINDAYIA